MIDEKRLIEEIDNKVAGLTNIQIFQIADIIERQQKVGECDRDCKDCWKTKFVNNAKPKEHADGWIPCSERLPECEWGYETKELMYQLKGTDSIEIGYYGEGGHYRDRYFRTYRDMYEGVDVSEVIAWMPLPPAYKGE